MSLGTALYQLLVNLSQHTFRWSHYLAEIDVVAKGTGLFESGNIPEEMPVDWWGYKSGFVPGGLLGAQSKKKKLVSGEPTHNPHERTAFHEKDQENLYNLVQVCIFPDFMRFLAFLLSLRSFRSFHSSQERYIF